MSRSNARSRGLRRRPSRTVPATIVAVVLLALGGLTAVAAVARLVTGTWPGQVLGPARTVSALTWGSTAVIVAGATVALIGLILVAAAVKPGPYRTARLQVSGEAPGAVDQTDFVISTRGLARLAAARADLVDGVDKVAVSASARRIHLQVRTSSEQAEQIRRQITDDVGRTLSAAGVQPPPRVTAAVRTKGI